MYSRSTFYKETNIQFSVNTHTIYMGMAPTLSGGILDYSNPNVPTIVKIDDAGKYHIDHFKGADPLHIIEAFSAVYWHKLLTRDQIVTELELVKMIRATESIIPVRYLPSDFEYKSIKDDMVLYTAITSMADQLILVSTRELILPEDFVTWLRKSIIFADRFIWKKHLQNGVLLIDAFRRGLLPSILTEHLNSGIKWNDSYQGRPKASAYQIK